MVAIDQLLTVATYAKIGNELNALNNTSWIATAFVICFMVTKRRLTRLIQLLSYTHKFSASLRQTQRYFWS